jgi:hypothetical protein
MNQVITVPPNMINGCPQIEPTNGSKQAFPIQMSITPSLNWIPLNWWIPYQTISNNILLDTLAKATTKEEMVFTFLASKAKHT